MRLGKMREPHYRIVVADARTKRDGRSIETIGEYHPKNDPSVIKIDGDRAAYWLGVGAQPTGAVTAILKVTGDWQKFKGEPAPPAMLVAAPEDRQARAVRRRARRDLGRAARRGDHAAQARRQEGRRYARARRPRQHPRRGRDSGRRCSVVEAAADAPPRQAADVLEEALEHLVRGIVDHPDDVRVETVSNRRGTRLEIRVHPDDLGRVIGRNGRTAKALAPGRQRRWRPGHPGRRRRPRPRLAHAVRWLLATVCQPGRVNRPSSSRSAGSAPLTATRARRSSSPGPMHPKNASPPARCC